VHGRMEVACTAEADAAGEATGGRIRLRIRDTGEGSPRRVSNAISRSMSVRRAASTPRDLGGRPRQQDDDDDAPASGRTSPLRCGTTLRFQAG
jgi:hypothetical protein